MRSILLISALLLGNFTMSAVSHDSMSSQSDTLMFVYGNNKDTVRVLPLANNAVRIIRKARKINDLPEMVYVSGKSPKYNLTKEKGKEIMTLGGMKVEVSDNGLRFLSPDGKSLLAEGDYSIKPSEIQDERTYISTQSFSSPSDEHLYGLGQFQDNCLDVRGLTRRLTQVNTQISIPFVMSNKGYGLLWNNYGMTDFNPSSDCIEMERDASEGRITTVNVTSTTGGVTEVRRSNIFKAELEIPETGRYALMLDVGSSMARRHNLSVDDKVVIDMNNLWLPPTASVIVELSAGRHILTSELTRNDKPKVYYRKVDNTTVFSSPVSNGIDYTFFAGTPDEVISSYRTVTGGIPMVPLWALGYIHCRERFHSQSELLDVANHFRNDSIPVDVIVQDWQYWGKYGWNAMRFDDEYYPSPAEMTDSLHNMDLRFMLSVWSKIDPSSVLGKEFQRRGYYIDGTQWVDFFNSEAASFYWDNMRDSLVGRYGIDALWLDATEPENDDLCGRKVGGDMFPGEVFRNAYPLIVNKSVYEGIRRDIKNKRAMLFTRSAFPGIQRYGVSTWSGDVGNDWETFRRQIVAGLGISVCGLPWWTYDAGGFFRPSDQYTDKAYHERFLRWLQTSVFLPLMRVHGYMSNTEFWNYGDEVMDISRKAISLRYSLLPYIYSCAADVTFGGGTVMRPLVMDFSSDSTALSLKYQYMFGPSFMVAPVVEPSVKEMDVYLPHIEGGWYDFYSGKHLGNTGWYKSEVVMDHIPVFVKSGSIVPLASSLSENTLQALNSDMEIRVYAGADGEFRIYEDEGCNYDYERGAYSETLMKWNDGKKELSIYDRKGEFNGMKKNYNIKVVLVTSGGETVRNVRYDGKNTVVKF